MNALNNKAIFIKNVYYMLAYAFHALHMDEYEELAGEDFEHMHDLFAAILARGAGRQVKQGLYREYSSHSEDLATVRGKIDLAGTIQMRIGRTQRVSCDYDELSENNLLNQIIKTTAFILLRHGDVSEDHRVELKRVMLYFAGVDEIQPAFIRWDSIRFQRSNLSYRVLVSVCQLVLDGMLITTDKGELKLATFVDDQTMSHLYEKFILEYYVTECPRVRATSSQIKWALDDGYGSFLPVMKSDVMLSDDSNVLIIDAKYYTHTMQKSFSVSTIHSGNLYQIFTYVKNKQAELATTHHQVAGMLLYAKTDEDIQPDSKYQMSGNRISARTLDLNQSFDKIRLQLDAIVSSHFP